MIAKPIKLVIILMFTVAGLQAQTGLYQYKLPLKGVSQQWHSIMLPSHIFSKVQPSLADLRIYGFKGKDTVEIPYILEKNADQVVEKETPVTIINQSSIPRIGAYYTFELDKENIINQVRLSFKEGNFDWQVRWEGSSDQRAWFTILDNYRILSIRNNHTDYQFTQLTFPSSKYKFYRLLVKDTKAATLLAAKILKTDSLKGIDKPLALLSKQLKHYTEAKNSIVEINLDSIMPIAYLELSIGENVDFYREMRIEYATDSFSTNKGIQYHYAVLREGVISSLEPPKFWFNTVLTRRLRVTIYNNDNKILNITKVQLRSPIYELTARFEKSDYTYALYYGNEKVGIPTYDLKNFENKIPISVSPLKVGKELNNPDFTVNFQRPLFENKAWLWLIIGLVISTLGYFSYMMLKDKNR